MSDDDIEFLDEDAEIVQQCVQSVHSQLSIKIEPTDEEEPPPHVIQKPKTEPSLLVERPPVLTEKPPGKKRKKEDDDSDYDPSLDSPHVNRRRRQHVTRYALRVKQEKVETVSRSSQQSQPQPQSQLQSQPQLQSPPVRKAAVPRALVNRREMTISMPDHDDPLCLPVRALVRAEHDARRLRTWNQLCMAQLRAADTPLRPRADPVVSSKRTVVIRNQFNKSTGKTETSFWSKIVVADKTGESKSDIIQSVLPRFREKKILPAYKLGEGRRRRGRERHEVILTKETAGGEETLVAYKPDECLAMVFKMFESPALPGAAPEEARRCLRELASAAACARCYHASWRARHSATSGVGERDVGVPCPLCARAVGGAAELMAHARAHAPADVRARRQAFCDLLAMLVPYQYRCRLCHTHCGTVRALRRHLTTHKGAGEFYCELGAHTVS